MHNEQHPPFSDDGQLLRTARYEVMPTAKMGDLVREHVPTDVTVTVTASPTKGLEPTMELVTSLASDGYDVVPHLAARMISQVRC